MLVIQGTSCRKSLPFIERKVYFHAMCEVVTVLLITTEVLWDVAWCCWISISGSYRGTVILRNVRNCQLNDTTKHPRFDDK